MTNRIVMGAVFFVFGLLVMGLPHTLLPACTGTIRTISGTLLPMKCYWTARMALGIGGLFCVSGIFLCLCKTAQIRLGISFAILINGLLLAATPTFLIGVCSAERMPCRMGTLPGLLVLSLLIILLSLGNAIYLKYQTKTVNSK